MRVMLLSDFYPPVVGGIERHVQSLGRELVRRGHEVTAASIRMRGHPRKGGDPDDGGPHETIDDGVRVVRLPTTLSRVPGAHAESSRPFAPPAPDPELVLGLAALVRRMRPDVVHAHGWSVHSWLPLQPFLRLPLVVTLHEYGLVCARKDLVYLGRSECSGPALAKCVRCASRHYGRLRGIPITLATFAMGSVERHLTARFIAVSDAVASATGVDHVRHDVIPNFLPDDPPPDAVRVAPWTDQLPSGPFLLFVGALGAHKGLPILFDAYADLGRSVPLVCIGHRWSDTPASIPPEVAILEDWPHEAVRAAWQRALVGIVPSTWREPFGIVALEAMAAGVPLVASSVGGLADVVRDGVTGFLVPPSDSGALTEAIRRLLADANLRAEMGKSGRELVRQYSADRVVPQIEAVYAQVSRGARGA
jgi:glycosyltransferase involved in cell wall biosynthesis